MGLINKIIGGSAATSALGNAAIGLAEVLTPNATKKMEAAQAAYIAALDEHGAEFQYLRPGWFDRFVNGLNRMPRPMLALGTLGLFISAMVDPITFAERMVGLSYVPEPLWWLLGAIVSFYFGARETHYFRTRSLAPTSARAAQGAGLTPDSANPALTEWRDTQSG